MTLKLRPCHLLHEQDGECSARPPNVRARPQDRRARRSRQDQPKAGSLTGADQFTGRVVVIIPTYNEMDNLLPVMTRVRSAYPPPMC